MPKLPPESTLCQQCRLGPLLLLLLHSGRSHPATQPRRVSSYRQNACGPCQNPQADLRERGTSPDHPHITELQEGKSCLAPPTVFPAAAKIRQPPLCEDGGAQQMADDPYIHGAMRD
ncbi:hypothetical protein K3495_g8006 [Podosphaera aphanis]|nr:hypothetical protein K3495_g8006 [Podosphaera aphanis]